MIEFKNDLGFLTIIFNCEDMQNVVTQYFI